MESEFDVIVLLVSAGILGGMIGAAIAILLHKRLRKKIEGG